MPTGESNPDARADTDKLKARRSSFGFEMPNPTQEFLDHGQYNRAGIEAYEAAFGRDFVSPGGADLARPLIACLELLQLGRILVRFPD